MATPSGVVTPPYSRFWFARSPRRKLPHERTRPTPRQVVDPEDGIPYDNVTVNVAKAAMVEIKSRLESHLAVKSAIEARAISLANNCVIVLATVSAAALYDLYKSHFSSITVAAICGSLMLMGAITSAYIVMSSGSIALPGRLPSQIWMDLQLAVFLAVAAAPVAAFSFMIATSVPG
jgi:hypothetical protein